MGVCYKKGLFKFIFSITLFLLLIYSVNAQNFILNFQNGTIINESLIINQTKLYLNSTNNHTLGFILYSVSKSIPITFNKLCSPCLQNIVNSRTLMLSEGLNFINVKDSDNETLLINTTVDTKKPIIKNILGVLNNRYSNRFVNITFIEKNTPNVSLSYKELNNSDYNTTEITNCNKISPDFWNCQADLSDKNGQTLNLFFNISDKFYNVQSKNFTVIIDTLNPVIQVFSPPNNSQILSSQSLFFSIGVNEPSKISYDIDFNGRKINLCGGNCTYFERNLRFQKGNHTIRIFAEDLAGNINIQAKSVSVV